MAAADEAIGMGSGTDISKETSDDVLMLLTAAMASSDALLVGSLIGAPCGVEPIVSSPPGTVFTAMVTEESLMLALPERSVKAPAATETTPSVVLLRVGVKVAV